MTERLARACANRPWRVLGGWVLAVVVVSVVLIGTFLAEALTNTAEVTTQTDSKRADQLIAERGERPGAQRGGGGPLPDAGRRGSGLPGAAPGSADRIVIAQQR